MTQKELLSKTVSELRKIAEKNGITLTKRLKADIVEELKKGLKQKTTPTKAAAKKTTVRKTAAKKAAPKKATTKKAAPQKTTAKKAAPKEAAKKSVTKKTTVRKAPPKKSVEKKEGILTMKESLTLMKRDLEKLTLSALHDIAEKTGLDNIPKRKADIVDELSGRLRKLRSQAEKTASESMRSAKSLAGKVERSVKTALTGAVDTLLKKKEEFLNSHNTKATVDQELSEPHIIGAVPPRPPEDRSKPLELPSVEILAAIAVEPTEIFVTWDLNPGKLISKQTVLRIYEGTEEKYSYYDIKVRKPAGSAYIRVHPDRRYYIEAGTVSSRGGFESIMRSNMVVTPPGTARPLAEENLEGVKPLPEEYFVFIPQEYGPK
jgi:hypothetical protein